MKKSGRIQWGFAVAAMALGIPILGLDLPSTGCPPKMDGDPREALLLGALSLPHFDAVTGNGDGSVRAYALATPEGLYAAVLSTEPDRGKGLACGLLVAPPDDGFPGDSPEADGSPAETAPPARPPWAADPAGALLCDWIAVRVQGPQNALFVLNPDGRIVSLGENGQPSCLSDLAWTAAGSLFGRTWAGEWLLPWKVLGLKPGDPFRLSILRGRKMRFGPRALEVLSTSHPGASTERWGGDGIPLRVPGSFPGPHQMPRALASYEVRPFVPAGAPREACVDAAPAGEVATAWVELPPSHVPVRLSVDGPMAAAEIFRLDFWWQGGSREEQDALFPVRVAGGAGDILVAERLIPQGPDGMPPNPWPTRVYFRCKVPSESRTGRLASSIRITCGAGETVGIPWLIHVSRPLPPTKRMAGIFYIAEDLAKWDDDLKDIANHGFNAVTSPAKAAGDWENFKAKSRAMGLDGRFALSPDGLSGVPGEWGYAADEPGSRETVDLCRQRAGDLRAKGFKAWAALCWPNSLELVKDLDGVLFSPNLIPLARRLGLTVGRWSYFQGLREDPFFNRLWAGLSSHAGGLSGFWVYCYAYPDAPEGDWPDTYLRHDACVENGPDGSRVQTVEWEALREGILDARLREALGDKTATLDAEFPRLEPVLRGEYWNLPRTRWDFARYRARMVQLWADSGGGGQKRGEG